MLKRMNFCIWACLISLTVAADDAKPDGQYRLSGNQDAAQMNYVGSDARVGVGVNDDGDFLGELYYVFGEDENSAWIGEGWFNDGAGGLKLNYHWLWGSPTEEEVLDNPDELKIIKAFLAVDQNSDDDQKATLGGGYEHDNTFWGAYLSKSITGVRQTGSDIQVVQDIINGVENGLEYIQPRTTTTTTLFYERPYEYGVGFRVGHFFDEHLWRLRGGLDYEDGKFDSDQLTFSVGVEKFFSGTGHSLALNAEHLEKSGQFEIEDSDTRASLVWRYNFGTTYKPAVKYEEIQMEAEPVPTTERKIVKNNVDMNVDAFFDFDKASIRPDAKAELSNVIDFIKNQGVVGKVSIVGHTCDIGTEDYNQGLSERRAKSVKKYLASQGIDESQLLMSGRGELQPKFPNDGEANRRKNRRVDIMFITVEDVEKEVVVATTKGLEWTKKEIKTEPAWLRRALRNPVQHKRTVDVYRFEEETTEVVLGEKEFLNQAPEAEDDMTTVQKNSESNLIDVLANDSDPDDDELTVKEVTQGQNGGVVDNFGDVISYTPAMDFVGTDTFEYTITDGNGGEATAVVTVEVLNSPPIANDDFAQTIVNTPVTVDVLANDTDADNDDIQIVSTSQPTNGSVIINDGKDVTYTPTNGFIGTDTFTYTIEANGDQDSAKVTIEVTAVPPNAVDDSAETNKNEQVSINVLANDTPAMGGVLTIVQLSTPANGIASINGDSVTYEPTTDFVGIDSFTYTIKEEDGAEATATVTVTVLDDGNGGPGDNNPPVAEDDFAETTLNKPVIIEVLANDSDPDGDPLTVIDAVLDDEQMGWLTINEDGTIKYQPYPYFFGIATFTYTISDGKGGTDTAVVTIMLDC